MTSQETIDQAKLIFGTGKMIRDRVLRILSAHHCVDGGQECCDISGPQMFAILALRDRGQMTITELSEMLDVSAPSASAMVDRLVDKGVLTREHSREDRRKVVVGVSPEAAEKVDRVQEKILQSFVELVEKIGPETARQWCQVLERVRAVMIQEDWGARPNTSAKR